MSRAALALSAIALTWPTIGHAQAEHLLISV